MAFVSIDFNPPPRALRTFGLIGVVAFSAFAAAAKYHVAVFRHLPVAWTPPAVYLFIALAIYSGVFALAAPAALRWLYVGLSVVAFPIGVVVSFVVVTMMFYVIITPTALFMRLAGRDALRLKFDPHRASYWIKRHPPDTVKRYFHQF